MKKILISLGLVFLIVIAFILFRSERIEFKSPLSGKPRDILPLEKYSFLALREREYEASDIILEKIISEEETYTSWLFSYTSDGKKITGMLNLPKGKGPFPVILMIRGYADDDIYFTGLGTRKAAGVFAENGFLTIAPDFLGFGGSDSTSADILEARFEKPVSILNLLESIKTFEKADSENIFLWAHSNGGQIAVSVLEIKKLEIPTVLWAPVVKGFPESVLYFMGELDDQGKIVKKAIDDFKKNYDEKNYSIEWFISDLKAPIQLHYGTYDPLVPKEWITDFQKTLKKQGNEIIYFEYKGDDHNLKNNWDTVVERDLEFFQNFFKK